jgi:DNA repair photolyase
MHIKEIEAKSILNRSKIHDYCVNPYTGCEVNCAYCYARLFMRRYSGHSEPWGAFVDVKTNAPELLRRQLPRARKGTVWISSVCDPYQPVEQHYELTRKCLIELADRQFPVQVQTKSALILRDIDIIERFETVEVGFTVTTDDERTATLFEPKASPVTERLKALRKIRAAGIKTFAFVGPLLPGNPARLAGLLENRANRVLIDRMNYIPTIRSFSIKHGFEWALNADYFREQAAKLGEELHKKGIPYEILCE